MKQPIPKCSHCGKSDRKNKLYLSKKNILQVPMKTYYCESCAKMIVPNQLPIK